MVSCGDAVTQVNITYIIRRRAKYGRKGGCARFVDEHQGRMPQTAESRRPVTRLELFVRNGRLNRPMRRVPFDFDVVLIHAPGRTTARRDAAASPAQCRPAASRFPGWSRRRPPHARPSRHPVRRRRPPVPEQSGQAAQILADRESDALRVEELQGELEPLAEEVHQRPLAVQADVQPARGRTRTAAASGPAPAARPGASRRPCRGPRASPAPSHSK